MTTSLTINKAWTDTTTSNSKYGYRILAANDALTSVNKAYKLVTPPIDSTAMLNGNKVMVFINITTETSSDTPVADMFLEMSPDGTSFSQHEGTGTNYITAATDINPEVAGYKVYIVDLTSYSVPYYRIGINSAGNDLTEGFVASIGYAYPKT